MKQSESFANRRTRQLCIVESRKAIGPFDRHHYGLHF
jgi:hypothetical protein